ncbi:MAG: glycosyltransferase family 39 protein [Verrucomicrobiae bacterium]|nr:glycosyltransferase family 39 protein [Verrucomicrobiae bacterium]
MTPARLKLAALVVLCAVTFFVHLGAEGITRSQEGRVLETAREMRERGDYLVPHLLGRPRYEKPPLLYWITAAGYALTGSVNELSGRVPAALFGVGCVLALYGLGRRQLGERAAFFAAFALATGPLFMKFARLAETDVPQAFFVTAALLVFLEGRPLLAWVIMGVGFLNKGPAALVIPIVTLVVWRLWTGEPRRLLRECHGGFLLVFLAISLSWYVAMLCASGRSLKVFLVELSALVVQAEARHDEGFFYYFGELSRFLPWTLLAAVGLPWAARQLRRPRAPSAADERGLKFALAWFLTTFVILQATRNKQPHYLLVLLPPCALMAGWVCDRLVAWRSWLASVIIATGLGVSGVTFYRCAFRDPPHANETVLRTFFQTVGKLLRPEEEFILQQPTSAERHRIALAFYTQRVFSEYDAEGLADIISEGKPLAVVTCEDSPPKPLRKVLHTRAGKTTWTLWKQP